MGENGIFLTLLFVFLDEIRLEFLEEIAFLLRNYLVWIDSNTTHTQKREKPFPFFPLRNKSIISIFFAFLFHSFFSKLSKVLKEFCEFNLLDNHTLDIHKLNTHITAKFLVNVVTIYFHSRLSQKIIC